MLISAAAILMVASSTYFPTGLVANGHPDDWVTHITRSTSLGLEAAGEAPCQELAKSGEGFRFVVRPWDDGPMIVRVEVQPHQFIRVSTLRLGVNSDESGFVVESEETQSISGVAAGVVVRQLSQWKAEATPYKPVEDGAEWVVERWADGACSQVVEPEFNFVATSLMLLGVDPNEAFANARRRRPHN